jgi:hypothetical protein
VLVLRLGPELPRLQQVKAACDPDDEFRFPRSIGLPQRGQA